MKWLLNLLQPLLVPDDPSPCLHAQLIVRFC